MLLASDEFYWLVNACLAGRYRFNAWRYPSRGFRNLHFPAWLLRHDGTGKPFYATRPLGKRPWEYSGLSPEQREARGITTYTVEVGENGLAGMGPLFGSR